MIFRIYLILFFPIGRIQKMHSLLFYFLQQNLYCNLIMSFVFHALIMPFAFNALFDVLVNGHSISPPIYLFILPGCFLSLINYLAFSHLIIFIICSKFIFSRFLLLIAIFNLPLILIIIIFSFLHKKTNLRPQLRQFYFVFKFKFKF